MLRTLLLVCLFSLSSIVFAGKALAQQEEEILKYAQEHLEPHAVQEKQKEETTTILAAICGILDILSPFKNVITPLICYGKQTHDIFAPYEKTIDSENISVNRQDIDQIIGRLDTLETAGRTEGTSSARVLAGETSYFDELVRLLNPASLFVDEKTAVTTRHIWPRAVDLGTDPRKAISEKMKPALLPAAVNRNKLAKAPTPTNEPYSESTGIPLSVTPGSTGEPVVSPIVTGTPTPIIEKSVTPNIQIDNCPLIEQSIRVPGTNYQLLDHASDSRFYCINPKRLVMHWSGSWSTAQATFNVLNKRDRSCQFAIDDTENIQMLHFFPDVVQKGWCAGGIYNDDSINFEITGAWFDDYINNPNSTRYNQLLVETQKTVAIACWAIQQYTIDSNNINGHYQLQAGKSDPGVEYLKFITREIKEECS